jgi:soluble lytic murein transglycosylase-like protein
MAKLGDLFKRFYQTFRQGVDNSRPDSYWKTHQRYGATPPPAAPTAAPTASPTAAPTAAPTMQPSPIPSPSPSPAAMATPEATGTMITKGVPRSIRGINLAKLVVDSAKKYNIDPAILSGLLKRESAGFQEKYVFGPGTSPAGAKGVAQFMPVAQRELENQGYGRFEPYDPVKSTDAAGYFLSKLADKLDKYGPPNERILRAMAAYNGGEGTYRAAYNKAKTVNKVKNPNFAQVAEFLPEETRKYVPAILNYAKDTETF